MPEADRITTLLRSRYYHSIDGWTERLRSDIESRCGSTSYGVPVLVRLMPTPPIDREYSVLWPQGGSPMAPTVTWVAERALVRVVRHLCEDQFVVNLLEQADQNALALDGHLDVTRNGVRIVAL